MCHIMFSYHNSPGGLYLGTLTRFQNLSLGLHTQKSDSVKTKKFIAQDKLSLTKLTSLRYEIKMVIG